MNARRFLTNSVIDEFIINLGQFISVFQGADSAYINPAFNGKGSA